MKRIEGEPRTPGAQPADPPATQDDPWRVLDDMRAAFKDVPLDEVEREVASALREDREEQRAKHKHKRSARHA